MRKISQEIINRRVILFNTVSCHWKKKKKLNRLIIRLPGLGIKCPIKNKPKRMSYKYGGQKICVSSIFIKIPILKYSIVNEI